MLLYEGNESRVSMILSISYIRQIMFAEKDDADENAGSKNISKTRGAFCRALRASRCQYTQEFCGTARLT